MHNAACVRAVKPNERSHLNRLAEPIVPRHTKEIKKNYVKFWPPIAKTKCACFVSNAKKVCLEQTFFWKIYKFYFKKSLSSVGITLPVY